MIQDFDNFQAATVVEKTSKTGLLSNKRVLAIRSGVLYYYSSIPKDFKNNDTQVLENMKETPKCSIQVRFLASITQDQKKTNELTIKFTANHAIEREEFKLRTSLVPTEELNLSNGKASDLISWTFKFQTPQLARWWLISLEQLKSHYQKNNDDQNLERFLESFNMDKKRLTHRQSDFKGSSNQNLPTNFRRSEFPLPKGLGRVMQEDENQMQEDQIMREVKLREDKMKRDMQEKFKKQLEARIVEETRQRQQMMKQREAQKKAQQSERLKALQDKQQELKRVEAALQAKLDREFQMIREAQQQKQKRLQQERLRKQLQKQALKKQKQAELQALQAHRTKKAPRKSQEQSRIIKRRATQRSFEQSVNQSDYHNFKDKNYLQMLSELFSENIEERLQRQTEIIKFVTIFKKQATTLVKNIIDQFQHPLNQRKYVLVKNVYSTLRLNIEFAFCETTTLGLNGKTEVLYEQSEYKQLRRKFEMANQANNKILLVLKKRQYFPLRIPLMFWMEYRGVGALVTLCDYIESSESIKPSDEEIFIKQIATIMPYIKSLSFKPKLVSSKSQTKIILLSIIDIHKVEKSPDIDFHSPITPRQFFKSNINNNLSTSNLKKVKEIIISSRNMDSLTKQKVECINLIEFSRNVRKLYRSGQGELNELELCNLVLKKDESVLGLFQGNLCQEFPHKGIVIEYLRQICGLDINLNESTNNIFSEQNIIESVIPIIKCRGYSFETLEVIELSENFDKYIKEGKIRLASLGLGFQKAIYSIQHQTDSQYVLNQISMHFYQKDYQTCIKQSIILRDNLPYTHTLRMRCFQVLLSCYKLTKNHESFLSTFREAMDFIMFIFGEHSYMISLYCILGQYLKSRGSFDESVIVYEQTVALSQKLGDKQLTTELYIDMNNMHLQIDGLSQAKQILEFTLNELMSPNLKRDTKAKLNQHLAKLYFAVGQNQSALAYLAESISHYELNTKKYAQELFECYALQLQMMKPQQERAVVNKILVLCQQSNNIDQLGALVEYHLNRLVKKSAPQVSKKLLDKAKDLSTDQVSETYVSGLLKKTEKNNSIAQYIASVYFMSVRSDQLEEAEVKEVEDLMKIVGKARLSKIALSL